MKTTAKNVTPAQLRTLGNGAAQAGDLLTHALCQLALGNEDYSSLAWLNDNTCLGLDERRVLEAMTVESALEHCVRAINDGEAQR